MICVIHLPPGSTYCNLLVSGHCCRCQVTLCRPFTQGGKGSWLLGWTEAVAEVTWRIGWPATSVYFGWRGLECVCGGGGLGAGKFAVWRLRAWRDGWCWLTRGSFLWTQSHFFFNPYSQQSEKTLLIMHGFIHMQENSCARKISPPCERTSQNLTEEQTQQEEQL